MIQILPNGLYSRNDLIELLHPAGIDADAFIGRLKPRKVFRQVYFGEDILEALRRADPLGADRPLPAARSRGGRKGKAVSGFTPEELGL